MEINLGDVVIMKKEHPCKNDIFTVTRIGMDIKISCNKCKREIMLPRSKYIKLIKKVIESGK